MNIKCLQLPVQADQVLFPQKRIDFNLVLLRDKYSMQKSLKKEKRESSYYYRNYKVSRERWHLHGVPGVGLDRAGLLCSSTTTYYNVAESRPLYTAARNPHDQTVRGTVVRQLLDAPAFLMHSSSSDMASCAPSPTHIHMPTYWCSPHVGLQKQKEVIQYRLAGAVTRPGQSTHYYHGTAVTTVLYNLLCRDHELFSPSC